jgi:hypothetical protein
MHHTAENQPHGAVADSSPAVVAEYRNIAELLWSEAEPFAQWRTAHPQFHRKRWAA